MAQFSPDTPYDWATDLGALASSAPAGGGDVAALVYERSNRLAALARGGVR